MNGANSLADQTSHCGPPTIAILSKSARWAKPKLHHPTPRLSPTPRTCPRFQPAGAHGRTRRSSFPTAVSKSACSRRQSIRRSARTAITASWLCGKTSIIAFSSCFGATVRRAMRPADLSQPLGATQRAKAPASAIPRACESPDAPAGPPPRGEGNKDAASVGRRMAPLEQPDGNQAVDHLHRAVVLEQHLIGQFVDRDRAVEK